MHSRITSAVLTVNRVSRCLAYRTETPARHTFRGICTENQGQAAFQNTVTLRPFPREALWQPEQIRD